MPEIRHFSLDTDAQTLAGAVKEDGAIIIDDVLSADFITQLRTETDPYMEGSNLGFDDFAGFKTTRTGGLMVRSQKCRELIAHPDGLERIQIDGAGLEQSRNEVVRRHRVLLDEFRAPRPQSATRTPAHDTALFRRLVLGWIEADFRVQIHILQHFSKSTRKSSSREQILQNSAKHFAKFCKNCDISWQILQIFANFSEIRKILQNFADFLQNFTEICRF